MKNLAELQAIKTQTNGSDRGIRVIIGMATCGIAAGAKPIFEAFSAAGLSGVSVEQTGCIGLCQFEPLVEVMEKGKETITYVNMDADKAKVIAEKHLKGGEIVKEYTVGSTDIGDGGKINSLADTVFCKKQTRISLRNCGMIDPENVDDYIGIDGYQALGKILTDKSFTPEKVIEIVKESGVRGRGGGGFSTGMKWHLARTIVPDADQKYVCCNADEGDPGAFMDRSILEGDPHAVIEAMTIAGYAIGADQGYIYLRAEYPLAVKRLEIAIAQAKKKGLLGQNIFESGFNFDLEIRLGAGAFVCGEETALMISIEGNRGEPNPRPPFPAEKGLFGKPTILNNVETYANIPQIILKGADWFKGLGTEKSKGTKVFALAGKINNAGLVEIGMGMPLREVIYDIGGGIPGGKKFKAAQTGGPSGGCIPPEHLDIEIDYDNLLGIGSMMGSGGLIVMDEDNCMVDIAKFFLEFTVEESCGKCTPCRIGTKRLYEMLEEITSGKATMEMLDEMVELSEYIKNNSLCGLGQTAPNPVLSTYNFFKDEYIEHVRDKKCSAKICTDLLQYKILPEKCVGCTLCKKVCPTNAIEGEVKQKHVIIQEKCIKCGVCVDACKKFGAIIKD
jgi:NADH:ubiquinone oxidoreductase subunit F (NADH-binding)/(2Fe-2S) ferredoxin